MLALEILCGLLALLWLFQCARLLDARRSRTTKQGETMHTLDNIEREARHAFRIAYAAARAAMIGTSTIDPKQKHPLALECARDAYDAHIEEHAPKAEVPPSGTKSTP